MASSVAAESGTGEVDEKPDGEDGYIAGGLPRSAILPPRSSSVMVPRVIVYAFVDDALSPDFPLGDALDVFIRREDADRFVEEVRGADPEVAAKLRIGERELEAGGLSYPPD